MTKVTRTKLKRRLKHLKEVLGDAMKYEDCLIALYHAVRDIQPGLCTAIAENTGRPEWKFAYQEFVLSDEAMIRSGGFLWPEEIENDKG